MNGLPWWAGFALSAVGGAAGLFVLARKWVLANVDKAIDMAMAWIESNPKAMAWLSKKENQDWLNELMDKAVARIKADEPKLNGSPDAPKAD